MSRIYPVVLCGGSGTRLWPRSRAVAPKPFLPLVGDCTLFEATLRRAADPAVFAAPTVVTGAAHLEHVEAQIGSDPAARIIVESAARNTAAAIAAAALSLPADAVMLVCPSDHYIADGASFVNAAQAAARLAEQGWLVAFGIAATAPETGFGYVKAGEAIGEDGFTVARFVEKPDLARAIGFLSEGGYSWNGGIFAFRAGDFLAELEAHRPAIAAGARAAMATARSEGRQLHPDPAAFAAIPSESVDYAVMENTTRAAVVPASMGWSDIGNWQALHAARPQDANGNAVAGAGAARAELVDCQHVMVESDGPRVSVIGLSNVIVVVDGGEVMVTHADGVQKVGKLTGAVNQ